MRIGEFAKKHHVSVDTIRHYMDIGLLIPIKEKSHYYFDSTCLDDMEMIKTLKGLQFTLNEIHKVLSLKRVTHFVDVAETDYFINVLVEKKKEINKEIEAKSNSLKLIDGIIESFGQVKDTVSETGVPLLYLSLFHCPHCQKPLRVVDALIQDQFVLKGAFHCPCGYTANIDDGIVVTPNLSSLPQNESYIYDQQLIEGITPSFISLLEKGNQWIYKKMLQNDYSHKVILETNIETYVFPPRLLQTLSPSALYIFCGNTIDMLRKLKLKIEHFNPGLNVIYIVNSQLDLPIKHESVDLVIDTLSFNDFSLFNNYYPLKKLSPYLKKKSNVFGYAIYYESETQSYKNTRKICPNGHPDNIQPHFHMSNLSMGGFALKESENLGFTLNPGYFDYHHKDDKLYCTAYTAIRY